MKDYYKIESAATDALRVLKVTRDSLRRVKAHHAADAISQAIKSVDGARRNATRQNISRK